MLIQMIFNPHSGHGRGGKKYPEILKKLKDAGHTVIPHRTLYRNHASEIIQQLNLYETDVILSVGGDGTEYEVVNGVMKNSGKKVPPIGIIPVGTGNSLAKDFNLFSMDDGIDAVLQRKSKAIDVLSFITNNKKHYFVNNMGFGFVADVSKNAEPLKKLGNVAYSITVITETLKMNTHKLTLNIDGKIHKHDEALFCYFCNSVTVGGNMLISPNSVMDDGIYEILVMDKVTRRDLLKTFPKIFKGTHINHPAITFYQGKKVTVETEPEKFCNPEGEIFGVTPLEVDILPKALSFMYLDK
ncbi:MAG: diacylglycerol kinase family protein [Candidatus Marinimicrobia bacterium]|nr:diacylglycerol kinase family protein [Candidatus Neomarinimicrobiota bacterium]